MADRRNSRQRTDLLGRTVAADGAYRRTRQPELTIRRGNDHDGIGGFGDESSLQDRPILECHRPYHDGIRDSSLCLNGGAENGHRDRGDRERSQCLEGIKHGRIILKLASLD